MVRQRWLSNTGVIIVVVVDAALAWWSASSANAGDGVAALSLSMVGGWYRGVVGIIVTG